VSAERSSAQAPGCLPPAPLSRTPRALFPEDACDCHFHVFAEAQRFPFARVRSYTPPPCDYSAYRSVADALGLHRGVIVQPSVYGTDNRLLVETLRSHPDRLRAVAVLDASAADSEIAELHEAGVRGLRINLCQPGPSSLSDIAALGPRIAGHGWHIQLHVDLNRIDDIVALVRASPVPLVLDHFGMLSNHSASAVIASLARALDTGRCWVKLSAPYRCGEARAPYVNLRQFARSLINDHGERALWGSDWPHTGLFSSMPDDADLAELFTNWCADAQAWEQILVSNPHTLYWQS
jgi:2-pyrone-4,6-dicarboxylate lactonase